MKPNVAHYDIQNMVKRFKGTDNYQSFIHDQLVYHITAFVEKDLRSPKALINKRVEAILNELCTKKQSV
tara:strand:+ start:704 stop:910 length:207 start_codon:yes stop_codon:yes gene_type:complete